MSKLLDSGVYLIHKELITLLQDESESVVEVVRCSVFSFSVRWLPSLIPSSFSWSCSELLHSCNYAQEKQQINNSLKQIEN